VKLDQSTTGVVNNNNQNHHFNPHDHSPNNNNKSDVLKNVSVDRNSTLDDKLLNGENLT